MTPKLLDEYLKVLQTNRVMSARVTLEGCVIEVTLEPSLPPAMPTSWKVAPEPESLRSPSPAERNMYEPAVYEVP